MENELNIIEYVIGSKAILDNMRYAATRKIFAEDIIEFLDLLAKNIMNDVEAKKFSDVITFAFWCRQASINKMFKHYDNEELRYGKGIIFHIAPSNVAVNFAYSLVAGMLAGNSNVVRLPSKNFEQVNIICRHMQDIIDVKKAFSRNICLIRYQHEKTITDYLSKLCDVRVIWGGNETIANIRESKLHPRAREINFADRFSLAVIDGNKYAVCKDKRYLAEQFYNDTYLNDQNACTSPKIILWENASDNIKKLFWDELHKVVMEKYKLDAVQAVDKWECICNFAVNYDSKISYRKDNLLICLELDKLQSDIEYETINSGLFLEYNIKTLDEMLPVCTENCQTLAYYGLDELELKKWLLDKQPCGIDRIVPIGDTLDFSLIWDGMDLIREMSKISVIREV